MKCKKCIDLNETSMMCKSCIEEHHEYEHPNDGEGKHFYGIPMCYCLRGIDIHVEKNVPETDE